MSNLDRTLFLGSRALTTSSAFSLSKFVLAAVLIVLIVWLVAIPAAWSIAKSKGRPRFGLRLGFWLGWVGVLIAAFARSATEMRRAGATFIDDKGVAS